jgi:hypothetical protein
VPGAVRPGPSDRRWLIIAFTVLRHLVGRIRAVVALLVAGLTLADRRAGRIIVSAVAVAAVAGVRSDRRLNATLVRAGIGAKDVNVAVWLDYNPFFPWPPRSSPLVATVSRIVASAAAAAHPRKARSLGGSHRCRLAILAGRYRPSRSRRTTARDGCYRHARRPRWMPVQDRQGLRSQRNICTAAARTEAKRATI